MIRRNKDNTVIASVSLQEFCELVRLELGKFEQVCVSAARKESISLDDYPFETWDQIWDRWRAVVPDAVRHWPPGVKLVEPDGEE